MFKIRNVVQKRLVLNKNLKQSKKFALRNFNSNKIKKHMKKYIKKLKFDICIIGLGYVGLPLAITFGRKFKTYGYVNNKMKIKKLKNKIDENLQINKKFSILKNLILLIILRI